jgi:hypothetical protein
MDSTVTLQLRGDDIGIESYARAIDHFTLLVGELSRAAGLHGLRWEVANLEGGSATTQIRAARDGFEADKVDEVVRSYLQVGKEDEAEVTKALDPVAPNPKPQPSKAFGVVTGQIQALSSATMCSANCGQR